MYVQPCSCNSITRTTPAGTTPTHDIGSKTKGPTKFYKLNLEITLSVSYALADPET